MQAAVPANPVNYNIPLWPSAPCWSASCSLAFVQFCFLMASLRAIASEVDSRLIWLVNLLF